MTKNLTQIIVSQNTYNEQANLINQIVAVLANEIVTSNSAVGGGAMSAGNGFNIGIFGSNTIVASLLRGGNVTATTVLYLGSNVNANGATYIANNLTINSTTFFTGNSTVSSFVNPTTIETSDITVNTVSVANSTTLKIGNSAANAFINSTVISIGSTTTNAVINSSGYFLDGTSLAAGLPSISNTTSGAGTFTIDAFALATYRGCEYTLTASNLTNGNSYQMSKYLILQNGGSAFGTEYGIILSNTSAGAVGTWSATSNATHALLQFTPVSASTKVSGTKNVIPV